MDKALLIQELQKLGLTRGDKVLMHSSLISLGQVEGGPDAVLDAFFEVLGSEGTLLVPVFGSLGILTEKLKQRPGAFISSSPVGTLAAVGADAKNLCKDHWKAATAHGVDTPFTRLAECGGYVCLLGVDQDRNTSLHSAEALLELPYLRDITADTVTDEGEKVTGTWKYFPGPHRDFIGLDRYFRESGAMKIARIGNAQVRLIRSGDLLDIALELGRKDPAFALCDNPACSDCVRQRAAIFADRMAKESFTLTVSSRLAGRYVPEMIENMQRTGCKNVELDYLQQSPCALLSAEKLTSVVQEFAAEGIRVTSLVVEIIPNDLESLIDRVKTAGIDCLILPAGFAEAGKAVAASGLRVLFRNYNLTGLSASAEINAFRTAAKADACFNPAGFAKAGENPFSNSYRAGRFIKITGQLDINDALFDGTPRAFARGKCGIKELISIFRCRNFDGFFSLGGGAVYPGTLEEAVADFVKMLDNM